MNSRERTTMTLPDFKAMYRDAANELTGELRCRLCDAKQPCTRETAAHYLQHGWPRHCDETMTLVTK